MALALVGRLTNYSRQMQILHLGRELRFFFQFSQGTRVGTFPTGSLEFSPTGAPEAAVGFPIPVKQKYPWLSVL